METQDGGTARDKTDPGGEFVLKPIFCHFPRVENLKLSSADILCSRQ